MNRYTFKAKRKNNGEWVYGYLIDDNGNYCIMVGGLDVNFDNLYTIDKDTICQCTGLQDRDGNYIFENDIVEDIDTGDVCYLVVFDEAKFKLNNNSVNYDIDGVSDFKIISNKFDKEVE